VREERDATAVRRGAEQPELRLDELVEDPQAEEDPGRDPDQEDRDDVRDDPGAVVQQEIGAQYGGDGAQYGGDGAACTLGAARGADAEPQGVAVGREVS
jgi:hypothetical protein